MNEMNLLLQEIADELAVGKANDYFDHLREEEDRAMLHQAEMYSCYSYEE